jgi:flavin-dependent dehydrogenase
MELPAARLGDVEVHFGSEVAPRGFAWAVPVRRPAGTFVRVGVMAAERADLFFHRMLARVAEAWQVAVPVSPVPRRRMLPLGAVGRSYGDRLLVVGDAAGLVKPTTGGGIYYSILSGELSAMVLDRALAADALSASSLREYESGWPPDSRYAFVTSEGVGSAPGKVDIYDLNALAKVGTVDVGQQASGIAFWKTEPR